MSDQAIAVRSSGDIASLDEFDQILLGVKEAPEVVDDAEQISKEILMQILSAESDEELENFGQAQGWRDLEGVPFLIRGFRWRPSDFEEGMPVFVVVNAVSLDKTSGFGAPCVLTTGSANVMGQLSNLARRDRFPAVRTLEKLDKTKAGFQPLVLRTPENWKELVALYEGVETGNPLDDDES